MTTKFDNRLVSIKYNYKKIILLLLFSILMVIFFSYLFLDAEAISLREPASTGRYRWVGELFYKNDNLISISSVLFIFLFLYYIFKLIKLLFDKKATFKICNNSFYQNEKYLTQVFNIENIELKGVNKNYFINIYLKNSKEFIENEENILKKIKYKILNFSENTPLCLHISFLNKKPDEVFELIKNLIEKEKLQSS